MSIARQIANAMRSQLRASHRCRKICKISFRTLPVFRILGTLMPDAFLRLNGEMRLFLF